MFPINSAASDAGRYTVTDAHTVYDNVNMLEWQRTVTSTKYAWNDAKSYCASLPPAGTWNLPNRLTLLSLWDSFDPSAFPNTPGDFFWTSSAVSGRSDFAWDVGFNGIRIGYAFMGFSNLVRCVR